MERRPHYKDFEASELYCPTCRRATPVRKKLLIVLPDGNQYDYLCTVCGSPVGGKKDDESDDFSLLLPH